jgi:GT2 family glycosyltransferase
MTATGVTPLVSVVVPTCRRPELLRRCLARLLAQTLPAARYEVIVVDDGHDDAALRAVDAERRLHNRAGVAVSYLRPGTGKGAAVARNTGWRAARAGLIAFTDDDTLPEPDWLEQGLRAMQREPAWSALRGQVHVPLEPAARMRPTDHELMTMGLERAEFVTANAFVRRDALVRLGGFDERFTRAWREDSDLQFRLQREAGPVGRCDAATVLHPVRAERWGVSLRQQRNAQFEALLFRKHRGLYRRCIEPVPPWRYYLVVAASAVAMAAILLDAGRVAALALALVFAGIGALAWHRIRPTRRTAAHMWEMLVTSALIPFLSVHWRLRGAWRYRVLFF